MSIMLEAMKKAGLASEADLKRMEAEKQAQSKVVQELAQRARALHAIPSEITAEVWAWEKQTGRMVPTSVLVGWSVSDYPTQLREWAKWLAASREVSS